MKTIKHPLTQFAITAMLGCSNQAFATTLQCDLKITTGPSHICELDHKMFCQSVIQIDVPAKTVKTLPKKSTSSSSLQVIEYWDEVFIRFSQWIMRGEKTAKNPGYVLIRVSELNRLTGDYEEREEYRHETGAPFTAQELSNLISDKSLGLFSAEPPVIKNGKCNPLKSIL